LNYKIGIIVSKSFLLGELKRSSPDPLAAMRGLLPKEEGGERGEERVWEGGRREEGREGLASSEQGRQLSNARTVP